VQIMSKATTKTLAHVTQFLDYASTHPDATIRYSASPMILTIHRDASYFSESESRSRVGGIFYLSSPYHPDTPVATTGAVRITSVFVKNVMACRTLLQCSRSLQLLSHHGRTRPSTASKSHTNRQRMRQRHRQRHSQTTSLQSHGHALLLDPRPLSSRTVLSPLETRPVQPSGLFHQASFSRSPSDPPVHLPPGQCTNLVIC
jgi:hypothetical protein